MNDSQAAQGTPSQPAHLGDMTTVARRTSPTEANLLKNVLIAAGIPAVVADANLVQADSWMANAYGGVRVMVRAAFAEAALEAIKQFEAGAFQLPSEEDEPPQAGPQKTDLRLWGPDVSAFWSFALTPVFGAWVHWLNSRTLQHRQTPALMWLLASLAVTSCALYLALSKRWDPAAAFQVSPILSGFTFIWYVFSGRAQSAHMVSSFGSQYTKRPLFPVWAAFFVILLLMGLAGELR